MLGKPGAAGPFKRRTRADRPTRRGRPRKLAEDAAALHEESERPGTDAKAFCEAFQSNFEFGG